MKKRVLFAVLIFFLTVFAVTLFYSCDGEAEGDATLTIVLTGASDADAQEFYAFLYASDETDVENPATLIALDSDAIAAGTATLVLKASAGDWESTGVDWTATAGLSYDLYIYTDGNVDGDHEPDTHSGTPLPKMTNPYPMSLTIAAAQTVTVAYEDMIDYDFGDSDGTVSLSLSGASSANTQVFYAFLYAEGETDLNNPAKCIATNQAVISGGIVSFTLEESDGAWQANGTEWIGTGGTDYDLYIYTDGNADGDHEPQTIDSTDTPIPQKTAVFPTVVTVDDTQSLPIDYADMVDYDTAPYDGIFTVTLTDAGTADTQGFYAYLYAEGEADVNNAAKLLATNQATISGGTATFTLEESDGAWGGNGSPWAGSGGTNYDLYIYTDDNLDSDVNPETPGNDVPQKTAPYPTVLAVDGSEEITVSYGDMVDYNLPPMP